jgi:AraC-like DNA-binding protein
MSDDIVSCGLESGERVFLDFENKFSLERDDCGIRIIIREQFYNDAIEGRFPEITPQQAQTLELCACERRDWVVSSVFNQLQLSVDEGIRSEFYYECKILELLFLMNRTKFNKTKFNKTKFNKTNSRVKDENRGRALTSEDMRAINSAKAIIDERLCECPKISELALMTNTSAAKLQNDFKTAFGRTIHGYVQTARLAKALEMIENSDAPIYMIARAVGCKKPGRFTESFKRAFGVTPTEYRRYRIG